MFSPNKHNPSFPSGTLRRVKQLFVLSITLICLLVATSTNAQEQKVKTKEDKTKAKGKAQKQMPANQMRGDTAGRMGMDTMHHQMSDTSQHMAMGETALPYTATYSSSFSIGNEANARTILNLWKAYDNNMLDQQPNVLSDTVTMIMADGRILHGRDSVISAVKQGRGSLTSAKSTVTAWVPLNSTDKNEQWVAIWGTEEDVTNTGTRTTMDLHEVWRFNSDGKIDYMQQYMTMAPPKR